LNNHCSLPAKVGIGPVEDAANGGIYSLNGMVEKAVLAWVGLEPSVLRDRWFEVETGGWRLRGPTVGATFSVRVKRRARLSQSKGAGGQAGTGRAKATVGRKIQACMFCCCSEAVAAKNRGMWPCNDDANRPARVMNRRRRMMPGNAASVSWDGAAAEYAVMGGAGISRATVDTSVRGRSVKRVGP